MKRLLIIFTTIMVLLAFSCTPVTTSTPGPATPRVATPTPLVSSPATPQISPEDAAWQKVIEAAKKEGKVNFYAAAYGGDTGVETRNAFKARYGIDVDIITGRGAEFTERLKTERRLGSMVADAIQSSAVHLLNVKNLELLELPSGFPVLRNKGDFRVDPFLDKDSYVLIYQIMLFGTMVNTKMVKPNEEPQSWRDLLDPKWKGKMLSYNPMLSTGIYQGLIPLLNAKAITQEWIRDIGKQDLVLTFGDQDMAAKLSRGEYPMSLVIADSYAAPFAKEGAPIKVSAMAEGNTVSTSNLGQIKNSPHPNAAKLFLNWALSPEGQTIYHKSRSSWSVRKDVPDFRPEAFALPANAKIVLETASDVDEESKKFTDKWLQELWKK